MASPETTDPVGAPTPAGPERRLCRNCNETKPVTLGAWAFKPGGEPLQICLVCQETRKADARTAAAKGHNKNVTPKSLRDDAKLDAAKALKTGAAIANQYVDMVMARVLQYAADPEHKLHGWAIQFLAERIMPRKLYEELGSQAAGSGLKERPNFLIQVMPAQSAPESRVVEGKAQVIEVLPAPSTDSKE